MRTTRLWLVISMCLGASARAQGAFDGPGVLVAVQERDFQLRHELTLGGGLLPLDAFYKGITVQLGYTRHFSDSFAWQIGRGTYSFNVPTSLRSQLESQWGAEPGEFRQLEWMVGSDLMWKALYGKTAGMNASIFYFEVFLLGGASAIKLNTGFTGGVHLGAGARVFTGRNLSLRLDVSDHLAVSRGILHVPSLQLSAAFNFGGQERSKE